MQLILWRHAEAEDANGKDDMARALTKKGHRQAERMAKWLKPRLTGDWRLLVSPSKRTLQTVERSIATTRRKTRSRRPGEMLKAAGWPVLHDVVVVGHQPTLGEVVSMLFLEEDGGSRSARARSGGSSPAPQVR